MNSPHASFVALEAASKLNPYNKDLLQDVIYQARLLCTAPQSPSQIPVDAALHSPVSVDGTADGACSAVSSTAAPAPVAAHHVATPPGVWDLRSLDIEAIAKRAPLALARARERAKQLRCAPAPMSPRPMSPRPMSPRHGATVPRAVHIGWLQRTLSLLEANWAMVWPVRIWQDIFEPIVGNIVGTKMKKEHKK
jgi:hypothetical protein